MKEQEKHTFTIRPACREDATLVFYFIRQIAIYEHMLDEVKNTEEMVRKVVFDEKHAEAVIAEELSLIHIFVHIGRSRVDKTVAAGDSVQHGLLALGRIRYLKHAKTLQRHFDSIV